MNHYGQIKHILYNNEFSHKFLVKYAYECACYANSLVPNPKPEAVKCLDLVKQWLDGKDISNNELKQAANAAYATGYAAASYAAANAAAAAGYAANAASYAYAATNAAAAANAAGYAAAYVNKSYKTGIKHCYDLLINMITEMSELEKLLLNIKIKSGG